MRAGVRKEIFPPSNPGTPSQLNSQLMTRRTEAASRASSQPQAQRLRCAERRPVPHLAQEVLETVSHDALPHTPVSSANSAGPRLGGLQAGPGH